MTTKVTRTPSQFGYKYLVGTPYLDATGSKVYPIWRHRQEIYSDKLVRGLGVDWPFKVKKRAVQYERFGDVKIIYHPSVDGKRVAVIVKYTPETYDFLIGVERKQAEDFVNRLNDDQPGWIMNDFIALDHEQLLEDLYE